MIDANARYWAVPMVLRRWGKPDYAAGGRKALRGEDGVERVADVLGDHASVVSRSPGQDLVVGAGAETDLDVEDREHVVTLFTQSLCQRRGVHLVEQDAGYDTRRSRFCWAAHSCSSRAETSALLVIRWSISSG